MQASVVYTQVRLRLKWQHGDIFEIQEENIWTVFCAYAPKISSEYSAVLEKVEQVLGRESTFC